jgi:hypothetical protein
VKRLNKRYSDLFLTELESRLETNPAAVLSLLSCTGADYDLDCNGDADGDSGAASDGDGSSDNFCVVDKCQSHGRSACLVNACKVNNEHGGAVHKLEPGIISGDNPDSVEHSTTNGSLQTDSVTHKVDVKGKSGFCLVNIVKSPSK